MKVIISGYGRMGHMVEKELQRRGIELVAASEDICSVDPAVAKECVVIDFTWPDAFRANYPFIAKHFKAAVVGTTGWNDIEADVFKAFEEAGTPLIYASNFSLGVNALFAAVERVSKMLKGNGYTPAVEETHHIHKLDAPSGTAKSLGKLLEEGLGVEPEITAHAHPRSLRPRRPRRRRRRRRLDDRRPERRPRIQGIAVAANYS